MYPTYPTKWGAGSFFAVSRRQDCRELGCCRCSMADPENVRCGVRALMRAGLAWNEWLESIHDGEEATGGLTQYISGNFSGVDAPRRFDLCSLLRPPLFPVFLSPFDIL